MQHYPLRTQSTTYVDFSQVDLQDWVILDSGATSNSLVIEAPVMDIVPATNLLTITIPNSSKVQSMHDCKLAITELPEKAPGT